MDYLPLLKQRQKQDKKDNTNIRLIITFIFVYTLFSLLINNL